MTDHAGGWPDPTRPGVPANPERTQPHWIEDKALGHVACVVWCHVMEQYHDMAQTMTPKGAAKFWRYLGPCLLPAEVAAREAAVKREGIEAALIYAVGVADRAEVWLTAATPEPMRRVWEARRDTAAEIAAAIRALLTEDGA